jgi:hypothetical protein
MDESLVGLAPQNAADYEAAIDRLLVEMSSANQRMRRDREEIERLKDESRLLREETRLVIASLGARL